MKSLALFSLLTYTTLVNGGFLTGHHPFPLAISSRTTIGSAVGGGPTSGAYSTSQSSHTISAPAQVQSTISTYHPVSNGYSNQGSQGQGNQGQGQGQGNQGGYNYGYSTNNPSVVAFGTYGYNQGQNGQSQGGSAGGQNGQGQNQGQRGYGSNNGGQGSGHSSYGYY
ncbi:hypothetical protein JTB14_018367 [Gonioctena quinquepunctata]|nr:hypothetical protein JTB14_018367 [Gonioctena quinquepunctata]